MLPSALSVHGAHVALVVAGLLVLVVLLRPAAQGAPQALAAAQLRRVARDGRLVELAESRARCVTASPRDGWVRGAVLGGVAAAWIHALVAGEHLTGSLAVGTAFLLLALAQTAWAAALLRRPSDRLLVAGAAGNALVVLLWAASRTVGLPGLGLEPVGVLDLLATTYELAAVGACVAAVRAAACSPVPALVPASRRQRRGIVLATSGTALLVLAGL